jgi:hypothetical protein
MSMITSSKFGHYYYYVDTTGDEHLLDIVSENGAGVAIVDVYSSPSLQKIHAVIKKNDALLTKIGLGVLTVSLAASIICTLVLPTLPLILGVAAAVFALSLIPFFYTVHKKRKLNEKLQELVQKNPEFLHNIKNNDRLSLFLSYFFKRCEKIDLASLLKYKNLLNFSNVYWLENGQYKDLSHVQMIDNGKELFIEAVKKDLKKRKLTAPDELLRRFFDKAWENNHIPHHELKKHPQLLKYFGLSESQKKCHVMERYLDKSLTIETNPQIQSQLRQKALAFELIAHSGY